MEEHGITILQLCKFAEINKVLLVFIRRQENSHQHRS